MTIINTHKITETVSRLIREANFSIPGDVMAALKRAVLMEESQLGRDVLEQSIKNLEMAQEEKSPMCQDTGLTVVFVEIGQEVSLEGGDIYQAIQEGVRTGSKEGLVRE